ncbi:YodC family protein [Bradyrhizobium tropiciagri]|uniref:YodC family protein n=1 Tax=Bradyrhizobium tropiciagri TaxID=312253 RepID=UPI000B0109D1|nr:DUF2158 domain-containing protein [Bradyrhizobium tropiciagri]
MLTLTNRISIAIAALLVFGMPPSQALSAAALPSTPVSDQAASALRSGNLVRLRSGGPLMTVIGIEGNRVKCVWTDADNEPESAIFSIDVLQIVIPVQTRSSERLR